MDLNFKNQTSNPSLDSPTKKRSILNELTNSEDLTASYQCKIKMPCETAPQPTTISEQDEPIVADQDDVATISEAYDQSFERDDIEKELAELISSRVSREFNERLSYYLDVFDQFYYFKLIRSKKTPTIEYHKEQVNDEMYEVLCELRKNDPSLRDVDWTKHENREQLMQKPLSRGIINYYLKYTTIDNYFKYFAEYTYRTSFDMFNMPLNMEAQMQKDRETTAPNEELAKELNQVIDFAKAAYLDDFWGRV